MHLGSFLQILLDWDPKSIPIDRIIAFGSNFTMYFHRFKSTWWTALIWFASSGGLDVLIRMWSNWKIYTSLIGIKGDISSETNLAVCFVLRYIEPNASIHATIAYSFLEIYPNGWKHTATQIWVQVSIAILFIIQKKVEKAQMTFN